eukprot:TRINITY_DN80428_c0_g1_i1.p1 TRINITY_DN80428_c0_g1~~TRINITY_DN80428_c0_g1_i1.p1  ORF type:complete len:351 (-),score=33.66 TRINITY_DN80428_c0_g1_i1:159-1211(-)
MMQGLLSGKVFIFVIYPMISFAVHLVAATVFCNRYFQTMFWEAAHSMFGVHFLTRVAGQAGFWVAFWAHSLVIGLFVTFMAEVVYKDTAFFNEKKRPRYETSDRVKGYLDHLRNTGIMFGFDLLNPNTSKEHPMAGQSPWAQGVWGGGNPFARPGMEGSDIYTVLGTLFLFGVAVQAALVLSDCLYGFMHVWQHKFRKLHTWSGHGYHHNYRYPLAMCGPWLAPVDLVISGYLTFSLPVYLVSLMLRVSHVSPNFAATFIADTMFYGYIHEMNDYDHCGKQCPTWSGFPFCPPLGFQLGLHKSIENHEAHHNYSNCGFGLLGVADRCMGTMGTPEGMRSDEHGMLRAKQK